MIVCVIQLVPYLLELMQARAFGMFFIIEPTAKAGKNRAIYGATPLPPCLFSTPAASLWVRLHWVDALSWIAADWRAVAA